MRKKKLLFILSSYSHGGTNKCLQNMLSLLNEDNYEYFILTINEDDIYKDIFSKYNIINCPKRVIYYTTTKSFAIRVLRYLDRILLNSYILKLLINNFIHQLEHIHQFDKVIAFEEGNHLRVIASAFKTNKISWIHCDYKSYIKMFKPNLYAEYKLFSSFDKIICVSKTTKESFLDTFPSLDQKTDYIYNVLNCEEIIHNANVEILDKKYSNENFTIVSIGRLHYIKQYDKIPMIVSSLLKKDLNLKFKWYIIGDGDPNERNKISNEIEKYQLQDKVICLGAKNNPYPYIKKANLLAVTSQSEAYPCVINEAKTLGIPTLSSNFDSVYEIIDEKTGIIATLEKFPDILHKLLIDEGKIYSNLKNKIISYKFENKESLNKLKILFN